MEESRRLQFSRCWALPADTPIRLPLPKAPKRRLTICSSLWSPDNYCKKGKRIRLFSFLLSISPSFREPDRQMDAELLPLISCTASRSFTTLEVLAIGADPVMPEVSRLNEGDSDKRRKKKETGIPENTPIALSNSRPNYPSMPSVPSFVATRSSWRY